MGTVHPEWGILDCFNIDPTDLPTLTELIR